MIRYKLYQNKNVKSAQYQKWYARTVTDESIDTIGLAEHMASHNSPYSEGVIKGVLTDMIKCIMKLDDLAIFSCGMSCSPADSASEFSVSGNVKGVHLRARATGRSSNSNLNSVVQFKEQVVYDIDKSATTD